MAAAAAADWDAAEERPAMEDGDIEDCMLGGGHGGSDDDEAEAEAGSLNSQRWPRSFRCVRGSLFLSPQSRSFQLRSLLFPQSRSFHLRQCVIFFEND
jgi:hypothetical protein